MSEKISKAFNIRLLKGTLVVGGLLVALIPICIAVELNKGTLLRVILQILISLAVYYGLFFGLLVLSIKSLKKKDGFYALIDEDRGITLKTLHLQMPFKAFNMSAVMSYIFTIITHSCGSYEGKTVFCIFLLIFTFLLCLVKAPVDYVDYRSKEFCLLYAQSYYRRTGKNIYKKLVEVIIKG